jgi:hypothetical protein
MVGVKMCDHNLPDITRADAEPTQLRPELFLGMYREADGAPVERMPARLIAALVNTGSLTSIDDDQSLLVLDDPRVDRQPLAPFVRVSLAPGQC